MLEQYYIALSKKAAAGKTTIRSIRLALRPAVSFLKRVVDDGETIPTQLTLNRYLAESPGQKAAITGFINYINSNFALNLDVKVDEARAREYRRKLVEKEIATLLTQTSLNEKQQKKWTKLSLEYFHGLPKAIAQRISMREIVVSVDGECTVTIDGAHYWVPGLNSASKST